MALTYPLPQVVNTEFVDAADWNALVDSINFHSNPPACRVYNNAAITIPDAGTAVVTYNSERFDTDAMHSTSSLTHRVTFNTAGVYAVSFSGTITGASDYTGIQLSIRLGGATLIGIGSLQHNVITFNPSWSITTIYKFAVGEWVDSTVYADNLAGTSNRQILASGNFSPELSAIWVGTGS